MDGIKKFFTDNYFSEAGGGTISLVIDIVLILALVFILLYQIRQKVKIIRIIIISLIGIALYVVAVFVKLPMLASFIKYVASWILGLYIIVYHNEIKILLEGKKNRDSGDNSYKSKKEKDETIKVICSTIDYLSKRKIGALITFERKDNLDDIIKKAISINADISKEILTTIFTVGTACHDGGVIIRNNRIACAGAYYPLSDNYDIPKILGTRHRAAIGISERFDAITIVVSEETGNISITISGNISLELTTERVASLLDGYLGSK